MQSVEILVNEIQLGDQLSKAVAERRGGDFGLLLAMMSQNVIDNAEFCLPRDSVGAPEVDEAMLRQQLGLAQPSGYSIDENSAVDAILLGVDLHTEGLSEVKLKGYLRPEPLALQDDAMHIPEHIIGNCEPTTMTRHTRQEVRISEPLEHNEAGLYEILEDLHKAA